MKVLPSPAAHDGRLAPASISAADDRTATSKFESWAGTIRELFCSGTHPPERQTAAGTTAPCCCAAPATPLPPAAASRRAKLSLVLSGFTNTLWLSNPAGAGEQTGGGWLLSGS